MSPIEPVSDERSLLGFESPQPPSVIYPHLAESYCSVCGKSSTYPASELTVVKHGHRSHENGHLMTYCPRHFVGGKEWDGTGEAWTPGEPTTGPTCPVCFIEVPLTRVCDEHGPIDN
jgi:hypothetical protein